jgi:hypothetical protein
MNCAKVYKGEWITKKKKEMNNRIKFIVVIKLAYLAVFYL